MLRKALIASFIAKPKCPGKGEVEMKNTECRRPSQGKVETEDPPDTIPVESVKCLVLTDEEDPKKGNQEEEKVEEVKQLSTLTLLWNPFCIILSLAPGVSHNRAYFSPRGLSSW